MQEKDLINKLYVIDNELEKIIIHVLDNDFKSNNDEFIYMLTSIEILAKRLKDKIKG